MKLEELIKEGIEQGYIEDGYREEAEELIKRSGNKNKESKTNIVKCGEIFVTSKGDDIFNIYEEDMLAMEVDSSCMVSIGKEKVLNEILDHITI